MTWDDGFYVTYGFNPASQLLSITENGATAGVGVLATFAYDDMGRRTELNYGNGTQTTYDYDAMGRLSQLVQDLGGTTHDLDLDFTYNPAGQIIENTRSNYDYSFAAHVNLDHFTNVNGLNYF